MAVVYQHRRLDTGDIFYVGIGSRKRRAYSNYKRSKFWHNIVNKVGYTIEVTHKDLIWDEACSIEKYLIAFYGRKDLGFGSLVNMTDGGDGRFGAKASKETREKMRKSRIGCSSNTKGRKRPKELVDQITQSLREHWKHNTKMPLSEETKEKIRQSLLGRPGTWKGKKHSDESLERMRKSHGIGKNNKNYGRKNSLETIEKMRETAKSREKIICPYCKKEGQNSAMRRWHFDKCKLKPII